jgi:hypothetical protein
VWAIAVILGSASANLKATSNDCLRGFYALRPIPLLPSAINKAGEVSGATADHHAALWDAKTGLRFITVPDEFPFSQAVDVNDAGHAVVLAEDRLLAKHTSFLYIDGRLSELQGIQAKAFRIKRSDDILGEAVLDRPNTSEPVLWVGVTPQRIDNCCGGTAKDGNERGQIVGDAYDEQGRYYAFLWEQHSGLKRIGPTNASSSAIAINAHGDVLIASYPEVYLYSVGHLTPITLWNHYLSHPTALSDCGAVVGSFGPAAEADRAFIWSATQGFKDLNTLAGKNTHWILKSATGINVRGDIVGMGEMDHRVSGFLMTAMKSTRRQNNARSAYAP